ncbi:hypothetical protein L3X38_036995 [Prunus dulcis]|uniref:Uncharacterized protein n=1 Tax=Prunus dulcis TaxID=3755 RepID=A0AAD4YQV6_PRUDU|nr:hypothetical protein L3X38_036995 [Prunus dulcis]
MTLETLPNSSFLQVCLRERFKGTEVSPLPYSKAKAFVNPEEGSYVPEGLPSIWRWSRRMQRKGQNFMELLDDVESFIFRPYGALPEGFKHVPSMPILMICRFHAAHYDRLLPTTVLHARLVSEEKRNLPFTSKSGEIVGDFSKLKQKLEKPSSHSAGRSVAHGKRKLEESCSVEKKKQAVKQPKKFIPKVAASGPPSTKNDAPQSFYRSSNLWLPAAASRLAR